MSTEQQSTDEVKELSQSSYKATQYSDSLWEVVGEFLNQESFEPLGFEVLASDTDMTADPMFADYGGIPRDGSTQRFHGTAGRFEPNRKGVRSIDEDAEETEAALDTLRAEYEAKLVQVREAAFEEGKLAAIAELDERMSVIEERYGQVLQDVGMQISDNITHIEKSAVELSLQIAQKLVGTVVEINPEYILGIVRESIQLAGGAIIKAIKVSPQDHEFLSLLNLPKQFKEYDGTWSFEADATVNSGCIVITSGGEVDFQLEPAWERIKSKVARVVAE
jgi:flagellar biosynthesis/type III secretory pathway protein FliH